MHSNPRLMALGIGLIAVLAACSNAGASSAPAASAAPTAAPSVAPSAAASQAPAAEPSSPAPSAATGTTVALADSSLGKILVDGQGRDPLRCSRPISRPARLDLPTATAATNSARTRSRTRPDHRRRRAWTATKLEHRRARTDGDGTQVRVRRVPRSTPSPTTKLQATSTARTSDRASGSSSAPTASRSSGNPVRSPWTGRSDGGSPWGARRRSTSGGLGRPRPDCRTTTARLSRSTPPTAALRGSTHRPQVHARPAPQKISGRLAVRCGTARRAAGSKPSPRVDGPRPRTRSSGIAVERRLAARASSSANQACSREPRCVPTPASAGPAPQVWPSASVNALDAVRPLVLLPIAPHQGAQRRVAGQRERQVARRTADSSSRTSAATVVSPRSRSSQGLGAGAASPGPP